MNDLVKEFDGEMALPCNEIHLRFREFKVKTTDQIIKDGLENGSRHSTEEQKRIYISIARNLLQYSKEELVLQYERNTQEWQDWCNDVALFYIYRFLIFNKYIPIMSLLESDLKK